MDFIEIKKRVGENIKTLRKSKKLTQEQFAEKATISPDMIKSIEQGRTWISDKTLAQITEALQIDVVKLFMPTDGSFKNDNKNLAELKSAIATDVKNYVEEVLNEF